MFPSITLIIYFILLSLELNKQKSTNGTRQVPFDSWCFFILLDICFSDLNIFASKAILNEALTKRDIKFKPDLLYYGTYLIGIGTDNIHAVNLAEYIARVDCEIQEDAVCKFLDFCFRNNLSPLSWIMIFKFIEDRYPSCLYKELDSFASKQYLMDWGDELCLRWYYCICKGIVFYKIRHPSTKLKKYALTICDLADTIFDRMQARKMNRPLAGIAYFRCRSRLQMPIRVPRFPSPICFPRNFRDRVSLRKKT